MTCTTARRKPTRNYYPHVGNVVEFDDRFQLSIAIPGYAKEDVEITIEDDRLSIKSKKEQSTKSTNYRLREWNYDEFEKHFKLADTIDQSKVEATFAQGVLEITLRKKEEAIPQPPKSITIQ